MSSTVSQPCDVDACQLLASGDFDQTMLRLAFVVYGGINRVGGNGAG
jgi:hypothetical protein